MARILIVDDREEVRTALAMLMEDEGHSVVEGVDGADVLPLCEQHRPDLILLDLMMPVIDGFQALGQLRGHPVFSTIPVIVISARSAPEEMHLAQSLGAAAYLNKPWSTQALLELIARLLNKSLVPAV